MTDERGRGRRVDWGGVDGGAFGGCVGDRGACGGGGSAGDVGERITVEEGVGVEEAVGVCMGCGGVGTGTVRVHACDCRWRGGRACRWYLDVVVAYDGDL